MSIQIKSLLCVLTILLLSTTTHASSKSGEELIEAAKQRNAEAVVTLLEKEIDTNATQQDGATALHWAAHWNEFDTAKLLLEAGARPNVTNQYGVTPLLLACADADLEMIKLLLEAGANPNAALPTGETPLMAATRTNKLEAVKTLLDAGAYVHAQENTHGQTALMWATSRLYLDVAETLIAAGAKVQARSHNGYTPLLLTARSGNLEAVQLLLEHGADVNEAASDGTTVLHVATVRGHGELVTTLLELGAEPNVDGPGYTPLHWAAGTWDSITVSEFINFPPQDSGTNHEWNVMSGLPEDMQLDVMKALLEHGADPNIKTTGPVPRFGYSFHNLVNAGGNARGATPFLLAAAGGKVAAMKLLVEHGADPLLKTIDNTTPLMVAAGMTAIEEEHDTLESDHLEAVKLCLELGADVNAVNDIGNTALHATALLGYPAIAKYLIVEADAEVNPVNDIGETPLRLAEGTVINAMFFIHDKVAAVLRDLGGLSDGMFACTAAMKKAASINSQSTVCDPDYVNPPTQQ